MEWWGVNDDWMFNMMNVMKWLVVRLLCKRWFWNIIVFFEVIVVDDDYVDDFIDDDLLMMMNSYIQNDDDIDDEHDMLMCLNMNAFFWWNTWKHIFCENRRTWSK